VEAYDIEENDIVKFTLHIEDSGILVKVFDMDRNNKALMHFPGILILHFFCIFYF